MSGLSHCNVGLTAHAMATYLKALAALKNSKGQKLGDILIETQIINTAIERAIQEGVTAPAKIAEKLNQMPDIQALSRKVDAKLVRSYQARKSKKYVDGDTAKRTLSPDMVTVLSPNQEFSGDTSKKNPDNPLNGNIRNFQRLIRDGEVVNVEAVLPGDVVEDFWNDRLKGRREHSSNYRREDYDTYIVTVVDKDASGNVMTEEYKDPETLEIKKRPKTSIRAISYNAHRGDEDQDTAEGTIIQDEALMEALKGLGEQVGRQIKSRNPENAAKKLEEHYGKKIKAALGEDASAKSVSSYGKAKKMGDGFRIFVGGKVAGEGDAERMRKALPEAFLRRQQEKKKA